MRPVSRCGCERRSVVENQGVAIVAGDLWERITAVPGMDRLLPALEDLPPVYLVGGAVRDLLRGAAAVDLDVCVEGDALAAARALAERLDGSVLEHERFGTATLRAGELSVDLAATRRERYERPGALPLVEPAPLAEDLARRDFAINAIAIGLTEPGRGTLHDPCGGLEDLRAGAVRVLHAGSFLDDPTRLLRAVRYEVRLDYAMDAATESLARAAVAAGALDTVSGARLGDELLALLAESEHPQALRRLHALELDRALHPALAPDPDVVAAAALGAAETGADRTLAALAALLLPAVEELEPWLELLQLDRSVCARVGRGARAGPALARGLSTELAPSEVYELLRSEPPEALALALALGAPAPAILGYVSRLRHVRLEVTGADLRAAGVPESEAIGRALEEALRRKLDGELSGRDEELRFALEIAGAPER